MTHPLLTLAKNVAGCLPQPVRRVFYRLGPFTRLLRSSLNKAAPVGIQQVQIAAGLLRGHSLDMQSEKDYWLGTYEPELQDAIRQWVAPAVLEAGAAWATPATGTRGRPSGQVYCFEPLPGNIERLSQNLDLNRDVCRFQVMPMAVAGESGQAQFQVHASDDMGKLVGSAGRPETYQQSITVETVSLDDIAYKRHTPPPQVVKMDIEGGEVLALPGMERLLHEAKPVFLLELHGPESVRAAWQVLTQAGYSIHHLSKGYPQVADPDELNWKAYLLGRPPA